LIVFITSCSEEKNKELAKAICTNDDYAFLKKLNRDVVKTGFNAGDGYGEVWIRDYNTFITLAAARGGVILNTILSCEKGKV
jgi:hypothetical protein